MKIIQFVLVMLSFGLFFVSCSKQKQSETSNSISIEFKSIDKDKVLRFSEVFDSIRYTVLETTDDCLIGRPSKVVRRGDLLIVGDNEITNSLYFFTTAGKFINKISCEGQGPGEYVEITDYCIGEQGTVCIFDSKQNKIITYDFKGRYLKTCRLKDVFADYLGFIPGLNFYVVYSSYRNCPGGYNLMLYDESGKLQGSFLKNEANPKNERIVAAIDLSGYVNGKMLVNQLYDPVLYHIDSGNPSPAYTLDFGKYALPADYLQRDQISRNDPYCKVLYSRETSNCLYYCVAKQQRIGIGFYFKKEKKNLTAAGPVAGLPLLNDLDRMDFYNFFGSSDNCFYSFYEKAAIAGSEHAIPCLKKLVPQSDIESNPILVTYFVKQTQ